MDTVLSAMPPGTLHYEGDRNGREGLAVQLYDLDWISVFSEPVAPHGVLTFASQLFSSLR